MNMNRRIARSVATVLATTAVFGTQVIGTYAAPVTAVPISTETTQAPATTTKKAPVLSKETLVKYYNDNFDVEAYKKAYPDLIAAFGANADPSVYLNHYLEHGIKEGRNAGGFDAIAFIINNYDYFAEHGLDADFPFFNAEKYKAAYPDLAAAFGNDMSLYLQHYLTKGIFENRSSESKVDLIAFEKEHPDAKIKASMDMSKLKVETVTQMFETATAIVPPAAVPQEEENVPMEGGHVYTADEKAVYDISAYLAAKEAWSKSQPDIRAYLEKTSYYQDRRAWEDKEPDIHDYLSEEGNRVYDEWMSEEPNYWEYLMETAYGALYDEWEEAMPVREDYIVGFTSESAAQEALAEDHAEWEAGKPKQSDYLDSNAYNAALEEYEAREPKAEDYPYFEKGYTSEDVAKQAYQNAHSQWESNKPAKQDYEAELSEYTQSNPEPQLTAYTSKVNTYESAEAAAQAYNTAHTEWENADAETRGDEPQESDYVYYEDGYASAEDATSAYNSAHSTWENNKPVQESDEDYNQKVADYERDHAEPVESDYTAKVNKYESQSAATEAFNAAHAEWESNAPAQEDYPDTASFNSAMQSYVQENPEPKITDDAYKLGYADEEAAQAAYDADLEDHMNAMPKDDGYIEQSNWKEDHDEWLENGPDLSDEMSEVDGKTYAEAYGEWQSEEPIDTDYLEGTGYEEEFEEWLSKRPNQEDYKK